MEKYLNEIRSYDSLNGWNQLNITSIIRNMIIERRQTYASSALEKRKVIDFIAENLDEIIQKLTAEEIRGFCMMYLKNGEFSKSPKNLMKLYTLINERIDAEIIAGNKVDRQMCEAVELLLKNLPKVCKLQGYFESNLHSLFSKTAMPVKICAYKTLKGKDEAFDSEVRSEIHKNLETYLANQNADALSANIEALTSDGLFGEDEYTFLHEFEIMQTRAMEEKNPENMELTTKTCKYLDDYFDLYIQELGENIPQIMDLINESLPPLKFMIIDKYRDTSSKELRDFMNDKLQSFKNCYASWLLQKSKYCNSIFDPDMHNDDYIVQNYEVIRIMLDELLQSENQSLVDIAQIGQGGSSTVYKIRDKVIKIGKNRVNSRIPMHRRLIQPLVRLDLDDSCIEVQERVEIRNDISKEDVYQVFCEMLDEGIIWGDAKCENVGVLLKDNVATLNGEVISVSPDAVNYHVREGCSVAEPLKAGELVIIDTDFVFYESERNKRPNNMIWWAKEFYQRYKREHPEKYDQNGERKPGTIVLNNRTKDNKNQADNGTIPAKTSTDIENR